MQLMKLIKQTKLILLLIVVTAIVVNSCNKDEISPANSVKTNVGKRNSLKASPEITTTPVTSITNTSAIGGGVVSLGDWTTISARGVVWGKNPNPNGISGRTTDGAGLGTYSSNIHGLSAGTLYYVKAYATNGVDSVFGEEVSFTTLAGMPEVVTGNITSTTPNTATVGGSVISDGDLAVTDRGVCYSTSINPTKADSKIANGSGTGSYLCDLIGLLPDITYHVRAYATNSYGTSYGEDRIFTTYVTLPTITSSPISNILLNTATGGGNVTSDGGTTVTERGVCWSDSHSPTVADNKTSDGSGTGSFSSNIIGLKANGFYYVRAYATNSVGTSYGDTRCLYTLSWSTFVPSYSCVIQGTNAGYCYNVISFPNSGNGVITYKMTGGVMYKVKYSLTYTGTGGAGTNHASGEIWTSGDFQINAGGAPGYSVTLNNLIFLKAN
jgi:hypothetical protein